MKIVSTIKSFFRRAFMSCSQFESMERESEFYRNMMSKAHVSQSTEYEDCKSSKGFTVFRLPKSSTYTISLNIKDMLEAGGYVFDDSFKWDVKFE